MVPNDAANRGLTPRGLAAMLLCASLVAAVFGAEPLDNWAAGAMTGPYMASVRDYIGLWHETVRNLGLDYPYAALREATRETEYWHF